MPDIDIAAIAKSRPPARVVRGEDFPLTRDGETYYPHAGEEVRFLGEPSAGFVQSLVRFGYLLILAMKEDGGMLSVEDGSELDKLFEFMARELSDRIQSWTWTDAAGRELPEHPSAADLLAISLAELVGLAYAAIPGDLAPPNV